MGKYSDKGDFKVGNIGGPGRPKLPVEIKRGKRITTASFLEAFSLYAQLSYKELKEISEDDNRLVIDQIVVSLLLNAAIGKSTPHIALLLDRLIGPVPRTPPDESQTNNIQINQYSGFSRDELTAAIDKLTAEERAAPDKFE